MDSSGNLLQQLEHKLKQNEELLEQTERFTKTGSYKINLQTGEAFWTKGVYSIFNYPFEKDVPSVDEYYNLVYADDVEKLKLNLLNTIQNHITFDLKYRIKTSNEIIKYVHSKGEVVKEDNALFLVGSFMDISEQVAASKRIEQSEKNYRSLIENLPIGIVEFSNDNIIFANSYFRKHLDFNSEFELKSKKFSDLVVEIEKERFNAILKQAVDSYNELKKKYILSLKAKNGNNIYVEFCIYEVINTKQPIYKCFFENISGSIKNYNYSKKLATDAVYLSRKMETYHQIILTLNKIIKNESIDKLKFTELYNILNAEWNLEQLWAIFQSNFEKVENNFFKKLVTVAPNLTQQELKHCAFIRMNFETKEIAAMFQVKPSSIQIARVRLKKKLNLAPDDDLINYIFLL